MRGDCFVICRQISEPLTQVLLLHCFKIWRFLRSAAKLDAQLCVHKVTLTQFSINFRKHLREISEISSCFEMLNLYFKRLLRLGTDVL